MTLFFRLLVAITFISLPTSNKAAEQPIVCTDYDVFVVRHFEKEQGNSQDPALSQRGVLQAKTFSQLEAIKDVSHAFHTPYKRTTQSLDFVDVSKTEYAPTEIKQLVNTIKTDYCKKSIVVVGHSNTVPKIIKELGAKFKVSYAGVPLSKEPEVTLNESDYGTVFRVTYHNERVHQQLYQVTIQKVED